MIIDCVSDLHGHYPKTEGGDLLIVAGDWTAKHSFNEFAFEFLTWLDQQKYKHKIVIAGNHDTMLGEGNAQDLFKGIAIYLQDSGTEIEYEEPSESEWGARKGAMSHVPFTKQKLKIWGSPWTAQFAGINPLCCAFTVDYSHRTDKDLEKYWDLIPWDTDILVTHSPPSGIFDAVVRESKWGHHTDCTGSVTLRNHVMDRVKPQLHVFGHIHEWGGRAMDTCVTKFVNASHVNDCYKPMYKPVRVIL